MERDTRSTALPKNPHSTLDKDLTLWNTVILIFIFVNKALFIRWVYFLGLTVIVKYL